MKKFEGLIENKELSTNEVEAYNYKNGIIKIMMDEYVPDPREWDNLGIIICREHRRYDFPNESPTKFEYFDTGEEMRKYMKEELGALVILPIYLYDHSGITVSTGRGYPYNDPWDSSFLGYIYTTQERCDELGVKYDDLNQVEEWLRDEIREWDDCLRGESYRWESYVIVGGEEVSEDSCGGYLGSSGKEIAIEEAMRNIDWYNEKHPQLFEFA